MISVFDGETHENPWNTNHRSVLFRQTKAAWASSPLRQNFIVTQSPARVETLENPSENLIVHRRIVVRNVIALVIKGIILVVNDCINVFERACHRHPGIFRGTLQVFLIWYMTIGVRWDLTPWRSDGKIFGVFGPVSWQLQENDEFINWWIKGSKSDSPNYWWVVWNMNGL